MKKFHIFLLFVFQAFMATAQQTPMSAGRINLLTNEDRFQYINPFDARTVQLVGERYFFDSIYVTGELQTNKNLYTTELLYRFDQIERTIQVKLENGKQLYINEKDVVYCKLFIGGQTVEFVPVSVPNGRKLTLLQVIYKSPTMQLYRDIRKYIYRVKSENIDGYSSENIYDEVRKDYRYYFRKGEKGVFKAIKIDIKSFVAAIPEKRSQVVTLFKAGQKSGLNVTKLAQIMAELDKKAEFK